MKFKLFLLCVVFLSIFACQQIDDEIGEVLEIHQANNFRSNIAQEYFVEAPSTITISEDYSSSTPEERLAAANDLISAKYVAFGWFLNTYIIDKETIHSTNSNYGGFHALARVSSFRTVDIQPTDNPLVFNFVFRAEIGGTQDLLNLIPNITDNEGRRILRLQMPKISNSELKNASWMNNKSYSQNVFDPANFTADQLEVIDLVITAEQRSTNGYIDINRLIEDGVIKIGVHFGYDYNSGRYDRVEAEQLFNLLVTDGFTSPVSTFADLRLDSDPLVRNVDANGNSVKIEVKIVSSSMVDPVADAKKLKDALIESYSTREVILFNGHAGYSGKLLPGNWQSTSAGNINPEEFATLPLPYDTYQIFLINGCDTYSKFADQFRANPAKHDEEGNLIDVNIVTTTSFAYMNILADISFEIIKALMGSNGEINPVTWDEVFLQINNISLNKTFYGIHGIDNNPHIHPYADLTKLCTECENNTICGEGSMCVRLSKQNISVCGAICIDDAGCPENYRCADVLLNNIINSRVCAPINNICDGVWHQVDEKIESLHPHDNFEEQEWTITAPQNAQKIRINFSKIELERNFDYVRVYDSANNLLSELTGIIGAQNVVVDGNIATIKFSSDRSIAEWGFEISSYSWLE